MRPLLVLLVAACAHTQPAVVGRVDGVAGRAVAQRSVAGMAVAVLRGGKVELARGYGVADLASGAPVTPATPFRIMSLTKQFTAVALLRFVEDGKVSLDDPLSKYFPELPAEVTVRHILSHTSGLPEIMRVPGWNDAAAASDAVRLLAGKPLQWPPGTAFEYNNSNYVLCGLIVEKLAGRPLFEHMEETLFRPLGMRATHPCPDGVPGYTKQAGEIVPAPPLRIPPGDGSAELCSTLTDLVTWARSSPLRPETAELARRPVKLLDGKDAPAGLGPLLDEIEGRPVQGGFGGGGGFSSHLWRFPAEGVTLILLSNTTSQAVGATRLRIARAALGVPDPDPRDLPLPPEERARFAGDYTFTEAGFVLHVYERDGALFARVRDPVGEKLLYQGAGVFIGADDGYKLTFDAAAGSLEIDAGGQKLKGRRG